MNAYSLMYHDVVAPGCGDRSGFPGGESSRYKITLEQFAAHLRAIRRHAGRHPVTVDSVDWDEPDNPLLLTFDDGGASAEAIADCLDVFGWRGHFFVTTNYIGQPGFVTPDQIRRLRTRGHIVGSHSCSHPLRMARCSAARLRDEWTRSTEALSGLLGEATVVASVPGGDHSAAVRDAAAAAGIRVLFTSRPTFRVLQHGDLRVLGRFAIRTNTSSGVAAAVATGRWMPRLKQQLWWDVRSAVKAIAWPAYQRLREKRLGRSAEVRWGDELSRASEDPS